MTAMNHLPIPIQSLIITYNSFDSYLELFYSLQESKLSKEEKRVEINWLFNLYKFDNVGIDFATEFDSKTSYNLYQKNQIDMIYLILEYYLPKVKKLSCICAIARRHISGIESRSGDILKLWSDKCRELSDNARIYLIKKLTDYTTLSMADLAFIKESFVLSQYEENMLHEIASKNTKEEESKRKEKEERLNRGFL